MSQHRQHNVSEFGFFKRKIFTLQVNLSQYYLQLQTQKSATNIFLVLIEMWPHVHLVEEQIVKLLCVTIYPKKIK